MSSTKFAAFDLDGTLVEFDKAEWEFKWWIPSRPTFTSSDSNGVEVRGKINSAGPY
jgi:FMN phosphatase YigB (HAD superfamily)